MELVKPVQTRYQIQELISRWSELFGSISSTTILQLAKDGKFNLYVSNTGCRRCNLFTKPSLGRPSRKIEAYLNSEYINLHDFQIHTLLAGEQITIRMLKVDELKESDFIPGDEPFNLSIIEAAVIDEKERIVIKPDDIKYLSVTSEGVLAFEQELMVRSEVINGNDTAKASEIGTKGRRKRLKQKERDSTEGLLLIYELCNYYGISYLDELPPPKAWGKIVSGEFTSDLITSIAESKKSIELKGDGQLNKSDFLEKYRTRFVLLT